MSKLTQTWTKFFLPSFTMKWLVNKQIVWISIKFDQYANYTQPTTLGSSFSFGGTSSFGGTAATTTTTAAAPSTGLFGAATSTNSIFGQNA